MNSPPRPHIQPLGHLWLMPNIAQDQILGKAIRRVCYPLSYNNRMTPDLREVGEKPLLASLQRYLGKSKKIIRTYSEDCAVVASGGQKYQLFTIDVLVEGVHFQREYTPAYYIGRKGLKVSISDICAMGGVPLYFLLSLGAPPDTPVRIIEGIYEGFNSVAHETKIQFLGGNLSSSP